MNVNTLHHFSKKNLNHRSMYPTAPWRWNVTKVVPKKEKATWYSTFEHRMELGQMKIRASVLWQSLLFDDLLSSQLGMDSWVQFFIELNTFGQSKSVIFNHISTLLCIAPYIATIKPLAWPSQRGCVCLQSEAVLWGTKTRVQNETQITAPVKWGNARQGS